MLKADGDILLQAAQNLASQQTKNKSSSASVGVGVKAGGEGMGFYVSVAVSQARGNADGHDSTWTQSTVTAGNVLALQSGGDTTLRGAVGQADQILASVGGNLLLESQQDTSTYKSKQSSAGVSGSLCYGCASSVAFNIGRGKMNSDYASVTQQTGLKAGDGGFLIDVGGNTTLIGSVISSSQQAVADGLNHLSTGTLSVEDIKNRATYSASQVSVGGGYSFGGGDQSSQNAVGRDKDGNVASGGQSVPGSSVPSDKSGLAMGLPVALSASGSASSTTRSGISEGVIEIRDEAGQQALTGKSAAETIASLNRDTTDTLGALKPIFDKEKIEAGFEIGTAFSGEMGQFLTNRAKEVDALNERATDMSLTQGERDQARADAILLDRQWGPSGSYRRILSAVAAGAGGNVTGGAGQFVQSAAVNYLQGLAASEVKSIADALGSGSEAEAARAALHAVVGCVGAAASAGACGAGALGASASSVLGALLGSSATAGSEEKESRVNLISSIVAAISLGAGVEAVTAVVAARTEAENNYLKPEEIQTLMDDLRLCRTAGDPAACQQETKEKYEDISVSRGGSKLFGCKAEGEAACEQQLRDADGGADALAELQRSGWKPEELAILDGLADLSFDDSFIARKIWHSAFLSESGAIGGALVGGAASLAAAKSHVNAAKVSFGKDDRKLDFLFGKNIDPSKSYNVSRAQGNATRIGIADTPENRQEVVRLFNKALQNPATIVGEGKMPGSYMREFFLPGVTGTGSKIVFVEKNGTIITIMAK
ncbi:Putative large exoprotein involved in heme utilization or adhesion of ShlA/HecA/FhaA family [plant metagenome]|uniref:Large exoprotein involved in heme utilization or adhesion of ShlA/HecA/FhaA family n=1 Tax=plant metagenome TaxID=1297885 RepID=A0A484U0A6_9ZZZZ